MPLNSAQPPHWWSAPGTRHRPSSSITAASAINRAAAAISGARPHWHQSPLSRRHRDQFTAAGAEARGPCANCIPAIRSVTRAAAEPAAGARISPGGRSRGVLAIPPPVLPRFRRPMGGQSHLLWQSDVAGLTLGEDLASHAARRQRTLAVRAT